MRLAGQGGEQILRFLRRRRWVKGDYRKDHVLSGAPSPLRRGCPGRPRPPEKHQWMWRLDEASECAPPDVSYLLLLFSSSSFLSSLFLSSRLLWFLRLHLMRFLGWFLRGRLSNGLFFPLPLLSFLPLLLLLLGGTSRLKGKSGSSVIPPQSQSDGVGTCVLILTASSCIISSLSSSSWSLYFSLIFFNLFCRDEKDKCEESWPSEEITSSYLLSSLQWLLGRVSTFGPLVVGWATSWNLCLLLSIFLFLLLLLFPNWKTKTSKD